MEKEKEKRKKLRYRKMVKSTLIIKLFGIIFGEMFPQEKKEKRVWRGKKKKKKETISLTVKLSESDPFFRRFHRRNDAMARKKGCAWRWLLPRLWREGREKEKKKKKKREKREEERTRREEGKIRAALARKEGERKRGHSYTVKLPGH